MRVAEFVDFIAERQCIFDRRSSGKRKPWTEDKILQLYRFCNVKRENDTETIWIAKNWRDPYQDHPNLWFLLLVARFLNWHPTLAELSPARILKFDIADTREKLHARAARGDKVFTGAYTVSTNGISMNKIDYLCAHVFVPASDRLTFGVWGGKSSGLRGIHARLVDLQGLSDFMAGQVIADIKYARPYKEALDWDSFAVMGPGSKRGMNRVNMRPTELSWPSLTWDHAMTQLRKEMEKPLKAALGNGYSLHAQDVQNCLCEFDKYERVRLGEGRPRSTYPGRF